MTVTMTVTKNKRQCPRSLLKTLCQYMYTVPPIIVTMNDNDLNPECKNSQDCQDGEFCAKRRCIPTNCDKQSDCGPGNKCDSKKCIIGCIHKGQCPDGKNCIDYYCSIPPGNHLCDLLLNLA